MEPVQNIETTEIANYGMELSQMNLCLCTNCARNYKNLRDVNKVNFKKKMRDALKGIDSREYADTYDVILNDDMTIHFTQTHLMEIQTLFQLIDEYGLPKSKDSEILGDSLSKVKIKKPELSGGFKRRSLYNNEDGVEEEVAATEETLDSDIGNDSDDVIEKGSYVTYRRPDGSTYENEIKPDKFPLHKKFLGKRAGDQVEFLENTYVIVEVL